MVNWYFQFALEISNLPLPNLILKDHGLHKFFADDCISLSIFSRLDKHTMGFENPNQIVLRDTLAQAATSTGSRKLIAFT